MPVRSPRCPRRGEVCDEHACASCCLPASSAARTPRRRAAPCRDMPAVHSPPQLDRESARTLNARLSERGTTLEEMARGNSALLKFAAVKLHLIGWSQRG